MSSIGDKSGWAKVLTGAGAALLVAFLAFTTYRIYIYVPDCFATKAEVKDIKTELRDDMREIRMDLKEVLKRLQ